MELLQLKYFISAAETENFSVTANKFLVPTSNISQTVKRLEAELGCKLFDRSANRIRLNKNGRIFYEGVKNALSELDKAKLAVSPKEGEICGEIKLSICTDRRLVTAAIQKFIEIYPNVSFKISHSAEHSENSDVVIADRVSKPSSYTKQLLTKEKILLATIKELELNGLDSRHKLTLLNSLNYISMPDTSCLYRNTLEVCADIGFEPNITIITDDPFYIRKYVEMGLGSAFVPELSWQGQFDEKVHFYSVGPYSRSTFVFRKNTVDSSPTVDAFCRFLIEETAKITQKQ